MPSTGLFQTSAPTSTHSFFFKKKNSLKNLDTGAGATRWLGVLTALLEHSGWIPVVLG